MTEGLDFELGFAIDDPMGLDALMLARALIRFGKGVPPEMRAKAVDLLDQMTAILGGTQDHEKRTVLIVDCNVSGNRGGVRVLRDSSQPKEDDQKRN